MYVAPAPTYVESVEALTMEQLVEALSVNPPAAGYAHWDKLRHLEPPGGLTSEQWWYAIKVGRQRNQRQLPLRDAKGQPFTYGIPDVLFRLLHYADQRCSGEIAMREVVTDDAHAQRRYLVNSHMEEAIRSSQLEGATTSRVVAKELLRSGRPPADRSERMILNNYRALQFARDSIGPRLTPDAVLELQRILTDGTLDNPSTAGRLQTPEDDRVAVFARNDDSEPIHVPPPAEQLPGRLDALCAFANEEDPEPFIHPVVRGILLHLWLAYDHPFEDGNGRTARALFYWFMRERGYWLVEYLSISRILREAPGQYARSFLLTETDERDATYFLLYQLEVIQRATEELHDYLERKVREVRDLERLVKGSPEFNHRQLALLGNALRAPEQTYTFRSHAVSHGVTAESARNDILPLVERGLLTRRRVGRHHVFEPVPDVSDRLKTPST